MRVRALGRTGSQISPYCLGTILNRGIEATGHHPLALRRRPADERAAA
ncbi:hypothetical protein [Actinomadura napierensis]|uniref:Uncharacterized protein n=1 Tax=Actinomadura napierensis TaxID=267854 RepID=A0ABP5KNY6_9ACTN